MNSQALSKRQIFYCFHHGVYSPWLKKEIQTSCLFYTLPNKSQTAATNTQHPHFSNTKKLLETGYGVLMVSFPLSIFNYIDTILKGINILIIFS